MTTKKDKLFMDVAERTSTESSCISKKVGCVIVKDKRIISMGYNGAPSGYIHCDRHFIWTPGVVDIDITVGELRKVHHAWSDIHEIHAEMNAVMFAAKNGIPIDGATMYCTLFPCQHCLKNLLQCGIKKIIYRDEYDLGQYDQDFLSFIKKNIEIKKYES